MDGGRLLLRPVREAFEGFQSSAPVHAGVVHIAPALVFSADYGRRASGRRVSSSANRVLAIFAVPGVGTLAALLLLIGVGLYGARLGGEYSTFVAAEGSVPDYVARVAGFAIRTITISGAHSLTEQEVITASGIGSKNSLPFLDVQSVRARLKMLPMVKDASITKLFPGHVVIDVE